MKLTRKSILTGVERTRDIDITPEQLAKWQSGELIQNVAPSLSADDCEFIKTGATATEWETLIGPDTDDD